MALSFVYLAFVSLLKLLVNSTSPSRLGVTPCAAAGIAASASSMAQPTLAKTLSRCILTTSPP
jgi:hypothetical protein